MGTLPYHTVHGVPAASIRSSLPFPPPSTSTTINSCAAAAADLQHYLKGVQGREQKGGSLYSG